MSTHASHLHLHDSVLQQIPSERILCTHPRMPLDCSSAVREICSYFPASWTFNAGLVLQILSSQRRLEGEKREKKDETAQKKRFFIFRKCVGILMTLENELITCNTSPMAWMSHEREKKMIFWVQQDLWTRFTSSREKWLVNICESACGVYFMACV